MNCFLNFSRKYFLFRKYFLLFFLLLFSIFSGYSDGLGDFYVEPRFMPWGAEANFCLRLNSGFLEHRDTILRLTAGGEVNWVSYYRDENDLYTENNDFDFTYTRLNANWGFGIEQGLVWNNKADKNLLSLFLRYKATRVWNFNMLDQDSVLFDSIRPDKDGVLYNTFIASLILDNTLYSNETGLLKGFFSELSAETAPKWFFNDIIGVADFTKIFMRIKYFHPVYETEQNKIIKAIYLGNSAGIDYSFGNYIPLPARYSFGIHAPSGSASGGMVRGFERRRFDSELKIINNFDIRFIMPQVKTKNGTKLLRAGFLSFLDVCYFDNLEGYKDNDSGVLMTAGFSLFSEILFSGNCVFTVGFPIIGERLDRSSFGIALDYGLRF